MSEIGKIEQLTSALTETTHAHPLRTVVWRMPQPTISLAEHERTMGALVQELDECRVFRVHVFDVLDRFRRQKLSGSSLQGIHDLATEVCGPLEVSAEEKALLASLEALCGPKETPCPPHS